MRREAIACQLRRHSWGRMEQPKPVAVLVNGAARLMGFKRIRHCIHCFSTQELEPLESRYFVKDVHSLTWIVTRTTHEPFQRF